MARPPTGSIVADDRGHVVRYSLRFRADGKRRHVALGAVTLQQAETELENVLALVRMGLWKPPAEPVVVDTIEEPTMHLLASEWVKRRRHEVDARTVEHWRWALSSHLLPVLADYRPSQITVAVIERYKAAKLAERDERVAAIGRWRAAGPAKRGRMPVRPLSNSSINKTLKCSRNCLTTRSNSVTSKRTRPAGVGAD